MNKTKLSGGTVHKKVPGQLAIALSASQKALDAWEDITPLARNEWICLVSTAKMPETTDRRIKRTVSQLAQGKRRPCCWAGCIHR